jgi:selenoprotein W-related protein
LWEQVHEKVLEGAQIPKPTLRIEYCAPCNYLPRTLWHVEEILGALAGDLAGVELIPASNGRYHVALGDQVLFSKEAEGRFPEPAELLDAAFAFLDRAGTV